jgi:quercetin dioxygenase-like cupin family protein
MVEPLFEPPGQSPGMRHPLGGDVAFKVRGEQSGGAVTAFETVVASGQGPPLHTHAHEDETLYVLDGEVRFKIGDDMHAGGAGSFVFVPRAFTTIGAEVGMAVVGRPLADADPV